LPLRREFLPPRPHTRPVWAIAVSVALHGVLFLTLAIYGRLPRVPPRDPGLIVLLPVIDEGPREATMPRFVRAEGRGRTGSPGGVVMAPAQATRRAAPQPASAPAAEGGDGRARGPVALLGPSLGKGTLWVRPLPIAPGELARRVKRSHVELTDSAVKGIVQAFLDSIASEPGADRAKMPDWTTTLGGKKFGLDPKYIYIAGLKIPAAVLALLPIPSGGNQAYALDHQGQLMREDLYRAARRAETVADFKEAVRELRERKEQERQFKKAQREPPPSDTVHAEVH
jgi:hypothetical protein